MSKPRLVITAVVVEGRTHAEVAAQYGLSRSWVTRLVGRYRVEGEAAFEPRSRRPHRSPTRVSDVVNSAIVNLRVDLVSRGLDAGPAAIQWHLANQGHTVSISTIRRRLIDAALIEHQPRETAPVVLCPVRSRPPQRSLAVRLHPLPAHQQR